MRRVSFAIASLLLTGIAGGHASAQELQATGADRPAGFAPRAISGTPSSARHCISGLAATVHPIGWIESGSAYTITFDADIPLVAAVSRIDLAGERSTSTYGTPDLRFTASTSGTMALYVSGNGQTGCYRYKVEITGTATSSGPGGQGPAVALASAKPAARFAPRSITGFASSALHCVSGSNVANVHDIGRVEQGSPISVTFYADFDAIAGTTNVNLETRTGTFSIDDDSGGGEVPQLSFTASQPGTLALFVAGYNGAAGCYRYKVEIR